MLDMPATTTNTDGWSFYKRGPGHYDWTASIPGASRHGTSPTAAGAERVARATLASMAAERDAR